MESKKFKTVDEYIAQLSPERKRLSIQLRTAIKKAAPLAEEVISYNMPAYKFHGMLMYFAMHTNHIGFYPFTSAIKAFKKELSVYKTSRGTVQFPLDKKIPEALVKRITKFRVRENLNKFEAKQLAKTKRPTKR